MKKTPNFSLIMLNYIHKIIRNFFGDLVVLWLWAGLLIERLSCDLSWYYQLCPVLEQDTVSHSASLHPEVQLGAGQLSKKPYQMFGVG